MSDNKKIGSYKFIAEPFHVDFNGRLTMGVLGNHLLNCAGFHASERGFGIATLNEDNYTWVLSRLAIDLEEMPYQYEEFTVQTWVENVYRLFTDRNFAIIDKDGKKIGYARSVWAMINLNTRKPADLLTISDISFLYSISERPIKETISHQFGLAMNRGPEILGQYMHSMTIIRNLCAHGSRIYNRLFEQKPSLNKKEQALLIRREDGTMDNAHFFGFFLVMRRLLPAENFAEMKEAVIALTEKYPFVRMDYYGFRDDWKEKL